MITLRRGCGRLHPVDRDALLVAALGAAVLGACTPDRTPALPSPTVSVPASPVDPDVAVLTAWALAERNIAARYGLLVTKVPALKPLRTNHLARSAYAASLRPGITVTPTAKPLHGAPKLVVPAFAKAERALATSYVAALAGVRDPDVAALGAELAAGARQHAALLPLVEL
jgi:hypothetical protein